MTNHEIETLIDDYANKYSMQFSPSAIIQVHKNGLPIYSKAFGYSNIEDQILASPNDIYEWGSITKTITFAAVMLLEERGYLDLNEDIETYIGKGFLKKKKFSEPITMLHLMHHSAGFDETITGVEVIDPTKILKVVDYLRKYEPNQFAKPGEVVAYSNYGVALAGYIIELCSNMSYEQFVKENIFDKLGMTRSTVDPQFLDNQYVRDHKKAVGYYATDRFMKYPNQKSVIGPYPAGSGVGPATDLIKFADALHGRIPLFEKTSTLQRFLSVSDTSADGVPGNAHGFWELHYEDTNGLEHSGNTLAYSAKLVITKAGDISIVILTNLLGENMFCSGLPRLLLGFGHPGVFKSKLPDVSKFLGYYYSARSINTGFMKLEFRLQSLMEYKHANNILQTGPINYTQVRPGFFVAINNAFARPYMYANYDGDEVKSMSTISTTMIRVTPGEYRWMKFCKFLFSFFQWVGLVLFIAIGGLGFYKYLKTKKIALDIDLVIEGLAAISCLLIFFEIYCYNSAIEAGGSSFPDMSVFDKYTKPAMALMIVRWIILAAIIVLICYFKVYVRFFVVKSNISTHDLVDSNEVDVSSNKWSLFSIIYVGVCCLISILTSALGLGWSIYW